MPPVDTTSNPQKHDGDKGGDKNSDQTKTSSITADEKMREEIDSNASIWKLVADKKYAGLPQLAIEGASTQAPMQPSIKLLTSDTSPNPSSQLKNVDGQMLTTPRNGDGQAPTPPKTEAPKLDAETVKKYAAELHDAVNRHNDGFIGIGGGNDPNNKEITNLLDSLNAADRKAIEDAYLNTPKNTDHRSLRTELKDRQGNDDFRKTEAILNRRDGRTNDAGNLMVALSSISSNGGDAEKEILETFATLNSQQMKQMEDDFKHDYGITVDQALKDSGVSGDAMKAIGFLRKPVDERTAKDVEDFAHFAIDKKNLDYFGIALRGDTPAEIEARKTLSQDKDFVKQVNDAFKPHKDGGILGFAKNVVSSIPGGDLLVGGFNLAEGLAKGDLNFDRLTDGTTIDKLRGAISSKEINSEQLQALDILHSGHVSLATIAADNTGSIFGWFDNKKAIGNAADNATDGERQLFSKGYEIAQNGGNAKSDEDKNALNFYHQIDKAFNNASSGKDTTKWEDALLNGKDGSVISSIADGDGTNGRFAAVEQLSKSDWQKLKDPTTGPAFRKEIEQYVGNVTDKDETAKLLGLIDKKVAADTYEDSQKINRPLLDVISQNKGHDFLMFGTSYDGKNIAAAIANLSPDESAKYKNDAQFHSQVDKFVDDNLDGADKAYAKRLLSQVADTGRTPQQDPVDKLLSDGVNQVDVKDAFGDVEAALKDPKLRQKLAGPQDQLNEEEKQLKSIINGYVAGALLEKFGPTAADGGAVTNAQENQYLKTLYTDGRLTVEQKAELGLRTKDFFIDAATASPEERQKLYDSKLVNDDDKKLIDTLVKQNGKMDLADEIRSFVLKDGTDVQSFADKLKALTPDQKQALRDEYTKKYGSTIDEDLLSKVSESDRNNFRTYLTAGIVDGRQDYYDNLERALKSESGYSPDGSQEVLDRSLTDQAALLTDFQAKFEQLPADKQEQANKYFSEAIKDYQTSKEEFADKLYQVAVIVGGIAVGVATGGVGLAALATVAVVGAVGRVALKKAIEGNDYDLSLSNVLKDGAVGAITAGASVIGPETIGAFAGVGRVAAERFVSTAGEELVQQGLKKGGTDIVESELNNVISHAIVRGEPISEQAINQIVDKAAADGITPAQRAALESALKSSIEDSGKQVSEQAIKNTISGTLRQAAVYGTVGGTANTAIEGGVGLINGNLDISSLPKAFATGFAIGSTLSVGFEAVSHGAAHFKSDGAPTPAGTSEHLDLNFKKGQDGSIEVSTSPGKEIDLNVKVGDQEQTIHVSSAGSKLPDGAQQIGIKDAELSKPTEQTINDKGTVVVRSDTSAIPSQPEVAPVGPAEAGAGLVQKFKRWLHKSPGDETKPLEFGKLADTRVQVNGQDVPVNNGTIQVGRENEPSITDPRVSRNQGSLRWNQADHSFYYTDSSTNGTYIRNGDTFERLPKGSEVKLNPDQEIRLGAVNGPKLEFFNVNQGGVLPNVDRQIYVNGEAANWTNGSIELGRNYQNFGTSDVVTNMISQNHGTISVDQTTGQYIYSDHSTNGSFIKHANGQFELIHNSKIVLNANDEIHLGFKDGPTVKVQDTLGRQLVDGSAVFRRSEGDWITKPDGTKTLDNRAGSRISFNKENQITSSDSAYGVKANFSYAQNGELNAVKYADGTEWNTTDGKTWQIKDSQGRQSTYDGKISVERSGALRFEDASGKSVLRYPDGSEEVNFPGRQVQYKDSNPAVESQKLEALARYNFPDDAQAARFTNLMHTFESRGLPPSEVADTYRQINRLLSAPDSAKLPALERARLSEQILYEAAHPQEIDQGLNSTCNVACLETRAFERDPAAAARLITDVALTGKYVTPEGVTVDVGRTGGLTPDAESMQSLQKRFENGSVKDIKVDGSRTFAGQIFENTAINIHYADVMSGYNFSRNGYTYEPGDVIQYKKLPLKPGEKGNGEALVAYRLSLNGSFQEIPITGAPGLYTGELGDIYNRIVPSTDSNGAPITGRDSGFVVGGPGFAGDNRVLAAGSPQDLQNILLNAQSNHKLPIVLHVDSRDPIFHGNKDFGGFGGAHVITVERVHWERGPNGFPVLKADFQNQWGLKSNQNNVDINDLFRSTLFRDATGKIIPPTPQPLPPPIPLPSPTPLPPPFINQSLPVPSSIH